MDQDDQKLLIITYENENFIILSYALHDLLVTTKKFTLEMNLFYLHLHTCKLIN